MDELLEIAIKKYPIGTKFKNLLPGNGNQECVVTEDNHFIHLGDILVKAARPFENVKNSDTYIYYKNNWAEIIKSSKNEKGI